MTKRLNHENRIFKVTGSSAKESEPSGRMDYFPQSVQELKKEIDECDLCKLNGPCSCAYHSGIPYKKLSV